MRLRQIALVARDLDPVVEPLCAALGVEVAFRDPGVGVFGLRNAVMALGDTFLEVVSPTWDDASAARYLARRGGDAGYMVIVQSDHLEADRIRMKELGVRIVWETELPDIATIHLHPADVGGAILSLDEARPPASWRWAGPDWANRVRTGVVRGIAGAELEAADPAALAARWSDLLARPAREARGHDGWEIDLDQGTLRFVPAPAGRSEGLAGLDVEAADPARVGDQLVLCGTRIRFV